MVTFEHSAGVLTQCSRKRETTLELCRNCGHSLRNCRSALKMQSQILKDENEKLEIQYLLVLFFLICISFSRAFPLDQTDMAPDIQESTSGEGGGEGGNEETEQLQVQEKRQRKGCPCFLIVLDSSHPVQNRFVRGPKVLKDGEFEIGFVTQAEIELQLAEEKKQGIESMTSELEELHDLYQDVATLVSTQQEDIDKIDENVTVALDNVIKGVSNLEEVCVFPPFLIEKQLDHSFFLFLFSCNVS